MRVASAPAKKRARMIDVPTVATATELGLRAHLDAILEALGPIDGLELVDVGCGEGQNARGMAGAGARVIGFDPFIDGTDWVAHDGGSFRLMRARADALPIEDHSADLVLFIFSLHHVPRGELATALTEARRVLK